MPKRNIPPDLVLVIFLTLLRIPFVLIPPLNETPVLTVLSLFTIALAIGAWARRSRIPEGERVVVDFNEFKDFLLAQVFFYNKKKCIDVRSIFKAKDTMEKGFYYKCV